MTKRWWKGIAVSSALALVGAGCAHNEPIDQSRLAGLSQGQMQPVTQAKNDVQAAQQDLAAAQQAKTDADNRLKMAKAEQDVAQARFDQAKTQRELAKKQFQEQEKLLEEGKLPAQAQNQQGMQQNQQGMQQGQQGQQGQFQQQNRVLTQEQARAISQTLPAFRAARLNLESAQAKVAYLQKLDEISKTHVQLAEKNIDLAKAKLDQTQYQVFAQNKPAEAKAMKISPAQYSSQVAQKQADYDSVKAQLTQQQDEARNSYQHWVQIEQRASQHGATMQRAEVPPPPRG